MCDLPLPLLLSHKDEKFGKTARFMLFFPWHDITNIQFK